MKEYNNFVCSGGILEDLDELFNKYKDSFLIHPGHMFKLIRNYLQTYVTLYKDEQERLVQENLRVLEEERKQQ